MEKESRYTLQDVGEFAQRPLLIPQLAELVEEASTWPDGIKDMLFGATEASSAASDVELSDRMLNGFKQMLTSGKLVDAFAIILLPIIDGKIIRHSQKNRQEVKSAIEDGCDIETGMRIITDFFIFNAKSVKDFMESKRSQLEEKTEYTTRLTSSENSE